MNIVLLFSFAGGMILFFLLIGFFLFLVWVGAIVDILRSEFQDNNEKILWILLVILLPFIGTIIYIALGSRNKIA